MIHIHQSHDEFALLRSSLIVSMHSIMQERYSPGMTRHKRGTRTKDYIALMLWSYNHPEGNNAYSSVANLAFPFVTATPSFFAFSTISKRFFAPTAEAKSAHEIYSNIPISAAYVRLYISSISTSRALWTRKTLCPEGRK